MNLDNLNLVELNAQEIICIDGGKPLGFWDWLGLYTVAVELSWSAAIQLYTDYVATYPNRP